MATTEERLQILKMIQAGQITAEEGAKLLAALKTAGARASDEMPPAKWLRVRVTNTRSGKTNVHVTLPLNLVDLALRMAERFVPPSQDLDLAEIKQQLHSGYRGRILEVMDDEEGQRVEIFLE